MSTPPPIPFDTPIVNASNTGYAVGAIPTAALAADLAASGLTYSPGRTHGYKRHGERLDSYAVGDVIADVFADAALVLDYFLATDDVMLAIAADEAALKRLPFRDFRDEYADARADLKASIAAASADLPHTRRQLVDAAASLALTARSIRTRPAVRAEAIRRFRAVIPAPARPQLAGPAAVSAFLATVPAGLIARPDLHELALGAGLTIGSRTLYAAAADHCWPVVKRDGYPFFRVPE